MADRIIRVDVVGADQVSGWAPKSQLPNRISLRLHWEQKPPHTASFSFLSQGAWRDAFVSDDCSLVFKTHLPVSASTSRRKGSNANVEEYAKITQAENHGLPMPAVYGIVPVELVGNHGRHTYTLLFMERVAYTFREWLLAKMATPLDEIGMRRLVAMTLVTLQMMCRLVAAPYNYMIGDWHTGNIGFHDFGDGGLKFILVDTKCSGAEGPAPTETSPRRRMRDCHRAFLKSLKTPDASHTGGELAAAWVEGLNAVARVLEDTWAQTWQGGWGQLYDADTFGEMKERLLKEVASCSYCLPAADRAGGATDGGGGVAGCFPRTCSAGAAPSPVVAPPQPCVIGATPARGRVDAEAGLIEKAVADATLAPPVGDVVAPPRRGVVSSSSSRGSTPAPASAAVPQDADVAAEADARASSPSPTPSLSSDIHPATSWPDTDEELDEEPEPRYHAACKRVRFAPEVEASKALSEACQRHLMHLRQRFLHGRDHGDASMPLRERLLRDEWHMNKDGPNRPKEACHDLSDVGLMVRCLLGRFRVCDACRRIKVLPKVLRVDETFMSTHVTRILSTRSDKSLPWLGFPKAQRWAWFAAYMQRGFLHRASPKCGPMFVPHLQTFHITSSELGLLLGDASMDYDVSSWSMAVLFDA